MLLVGRPKALGLEISQLRANRMLAKRLVVVPLLRVQKTVRRLFRFGAHLPFEQAGDSKKASSIRGSVFDAQILGIADSIDLSGN